MIGSLLLILALILYFSKKIKYSILIYAIFCLEGFQLFTSSVLGGKAGDFALIYVFIITIYNSLYTPHYFKRSIFSDKIQLFLCMLLCTSIYSFFHYNFTIFQIFQASREYYLILSYY